jgi:phage shock protein A
MFEDLRDAFKEALDNFNKELSRNNVSDTADQMFAGMKDELASEKAQVSGLEDQITKTIEHIERLSGEVATARRREEMAREIDDNETVKLAAEFATKAEGYITVLQKKRTALEEEMVFRARTVEEMYAQFNAAREKRDSLTATAGRTDARESLSAANDLFAQFDRMEEAIEGTKAEAEAAQEFDELDLDQPSEFRIDIDDAPVPRKLDVDAALEELKRRMGED